MPAIVVKNVSKTYLLGKTSVPALRNVSFSLDDGDFTALVGTSGSGKSSLLNVLGLLDDYQTGEVWIDGDAVGGMDEVQKSSIRSRKIGFIFQSFNLIPVLTVFENVEFPLLLFPELTREEKTARVNQALTRVGLADLVNSRPDQLSGGQRQRVAIARALVSQPKIIFADEPTANLDSQNAHRIIDLMLELNAEKKVTFLLSTHDEKLMSRVRKIIRISDGEIQT